MFMLLPLLLSASVAPSQGTCRHADFNFDNPSALIAPNDNSPSDCLCATTLYGLWKDAVPRCAAKKVLIDAARVCQMDDALKKNFTDTASVCPCMKNEFNFTHPASHAHKDDACTCSAVGYKMWMNKPDCAGKDKLIETVKFCGELMSDALKKNFTDTAAKCHWSTCRKDSFNFTHFSIHLSKNDSCYCAASKYKIWRESTPHCAKRDKLVDAIRECKGQGKEMDEALEQNFTKTATECPCLKNEFNFDEPTRHLCQGDPCSCAAFAYHRWKNAPRCAEKDQLIAAVMSCGGMMDATLRKNFTDTAAACLCEKKDFNFDAPLSHKNDACSCAGFGYNLWKNASHCTGKDKLIETVAYCGASMSDELKRNFTETAAACKSNRSICTKNNFIFSNVSVHISKNDECQCAAVNYKEWKDSHPHCAQKQKLLDAIRDCKGPGKQLDDQLKANFEETEAACPCTKEEFNFREPRAHARLQDACACAALAYNQCIANSNCGEKKKLTEAVQFCGSTMDLELKQNFTNSIESCICRKDDFNFHEPESHNNDVCNCAAIGYRLWKDTPGCQERDRLVATVEFCGGTMDEALKKNFTDTASPCICRMADFKFENASVHSAKDDPCQCAAEKYKLWQNADPHCDQKDVLLEAADACRERKMELDEKLTKNFTDTAAGCLCKKEDFNFSNASVHIRHADVCYCAAEAYMLWERAPDCTEKDTLIDAPPACKAMKMEMDDALVKNFTATANECARSDEE